MNTEPDIGPYEPNIIEQLGCSPHDAVMVEDIMRRFIFHSTLDWQSERQFKNGVLEAWALLESDRAMFEEFYAAAKGIYKEMQAQGASVA
jgi:hypothetical protein